MRRSGFMYSVFAIFLLGLLVVVVAIPLQTETVSPDAESARVDETFYFVSSVEEDVPRAARIITKRAVVATINVVAAADEPLPDAEPEIVSGFMNGTVNGSEQGLLQDSSLEDWQRRMEEQARSTGYDLNITVSDAAVGPDGPATVYMNATYNITLRDPASDTRFVRIVRHNASVALTNMTDPLLLLETNGRYSHGFERCAAAERAVRHATGSEEHYDTSDNWTAGAAVTRPGNGPISGVSSRAGKVLVVDDICAYPDATIRDEFSDFAGVASEAAGGISADGSTVCGDADSSGIDAYVGGAAGATAVANGSTAVLTGPEIWQNNMKRELERGCYFADPWGPTVFGRIEGRLTRDASYGGWGSFLFLPDLPADFTDTSRSAVDHVYFGGDYGTPRRIKGVTDEYSWFKLDQDHIDAWNVNSLAYE